MQFQLRGVTAGRQRFSQGQPGSGQVSRGVSDRLGAVYDGSDIRAAVTEQLTVQDGRVADRHAGSVHLDDGRVAAYVQLAVTDARIVCERQPERQGDREEREREQEQDRRQHVVPRHDPAVTPCDEREQHDQHAESRQQAGPGRQVGPELPQSEQNQVAAGGSSEHRCGEQQQRFDQSTRGAPGPGQHGLRVGKIHACSVPSSELVPGRPPRVCGVPPGAPDRVFSSGPAVRHVSCPGSRPGQTAGWPGHPSQPTRG